MDKNQRERFNRDREREREQSVLGLVTPVSYSLIRKALFGPLLDKKKSLRKRVPVFIFILGGPVLDCYLLMLWANFFLIPVDENGATAFWAVSFGPKYLFFLIWADFVSISFWTIEYLLS